MSNSLKLKSLLGLSVLAVALLFGLAFASTASAASAAPDCSFSVFLKQGMTNSAVNCLQTRLNSAGFIVASTGAGSPGKETSYFGGLTRAAVVAFQKANPASGAADGLVGAKTRAALFGAASVTPPPSSGTLCPNGMTLASNCTVPPSGNPPVSSTGPVAATLASDNPASTQVVTTQAGADLAHFMFTGVGTVTNVTLKRIGISADASLNDVYLYDGNTRLTDSSSVTNGSLITFNAPTGLFAVNGSRTISVRADLAATSGESLGVQLVGFTATGQTAVTLASPISGNLMTVAGATLAGVSFGAITPSTNASLNPGLDILGWQSTATITTRDVWMNRFAVKVVGSVAKADLQNFRLIIGSTTVATVASMDDNGYVTFVPATPYKMITGSATVKVMVDVIGGASKNFTMKFGSKTDIGLVDSQYNVAFLTSTALSSLSGNQQTIIGGTMTVQKATDSPSSTVVANGTDQVFARYKVTTYGEAVKVDNVVVDFTSSVTATLRNGRVLIDGQQVGSTATLSPASTGTTYNINYTFQPGTAVLEVRADVYDNDGSGTLANGDTFQVFLYGSGSLNNGTGKVSGNTVDFPGSSNVTANTLTVGVGTLTLAKDQAYGNQTAVIPATAVEVGRFTLTSGTNEAINADTITLALGGSGTPASDVTNVYVTYGTKTASVKPVGAASQTWSISEVIAPNSSMTFKVFADLGSSLSTNTVIPTLTVSGTSASGTAVTTAAVVGQTITGATSGALTVTLDTNTPQSAQAVAGSTDAAGVLKVKLAGTNENLYVKKVAIYVNTSANTAAVASLDLQTSTSVNGTYTSVGTAQTVINDASNPGYAVWNLSGATRVLVPADGSAYLRVIPTYVSSGDGSVSGLTPIFTLGNIEAEGAAVLHATDTDGSDLVAESGIKIGGATPTFAADGTATTYSGFASTTATTLTVNSAPTTNRTGSFAFIDADADSTYDDGEEVVYVVEGTTGDTTLVILRGALGTTAANDAAGKIYFLTGVVGNAMTVLDTKLSLAIKSDSPSGATTGGTGKYVFGVTASAANNAADPATNTATITYMDITVNRSAATVNNMVMYPSEYDQNSTYVTNCVGLTETKWRCTLSSTGSTNAVDENTSRSYVVRADVGFSGAGSVDFGLASLGTSSTSTNSVYWTDGTTAQYWVNQGTTVLQGGSLTTTAASGTADSTAPTISSIVFTDGTADNALTVGATIVVTFSERMDPESIGTSSLIPGGSAVAVSDGATGDISVAGNNGAASGNDMLTITGIANVDVGATTFATGALTGAVTATLSSDGTTLTLTVTTALTGAGADGTEIFEPASAATTMEDINSNNATATGSNSATVTGVDL